MKKLILSFIALSATAAMLQAQTIAQWTFETSVPTTAGPYAPEVGTGQALGFHAGPTAVYSNPSGNGSLESFSANTWAVGDYWQFQVSTLGYNNVGISWDQASSSTGPRDFELFYSLNSGGSWNSVGPYIVLGNGVAPNPSWSSATYYPAFNFSPSLGGLVDNQATVWFALVDISTVSANGGAVAITGTDRVDNFTVYVVPEPTSLSLLAGFGLLAWTVIRRQK